MVTFQNGGGGAGLARRLCHVLSDHFGYEHVLESFAYVGFV
jgi:hypothetical protein